jgi:hypothetical protein
MKITKTIRSLFLIVVMVLLADFAYAAVVRISWDNNTEADLDGYVVYYGTSSQLYQESIDVGLTTSVDIIDLNEGATYFFAVTAYDTAGNESDFSSEAYTFIPNNDGSVMPDTDIDGIPDAVENSLGLDPADPMDSLLDSDSDGVVNLVEYMAGTSPLNPNDRPISDDVLKDVIGEVGEDIDLSGVNLDGLYSIVSLTDFYPEPFNNILQPSTQGAFLYNILNDNEELVYRLRVSATEQLTVFGDYEPGYSMNLEDTYYGISIELPEDAVIREVPIGIGNMRVEPVSALEYENEYFEFDILPYGLVLANPATITVNYEDENPVVQRYDTETAVWEDIEDIESYDGLISFSSQELGSFRIFSEDEDSVENQDDVPVAGDGSSGGGGCFITTAGF